MDQLSRADVSLWGPARVPRPGCRRREQSAFRQAWGDV